MGKIIFGINITIDGCCDHTKGIADEETHDYFTDLVRHADVLAYGRKTYELMVPYWPDAAKNHTGQTKAMIDFAKAFDSREKVVFSQTLERVEDKNSRLVRTKPEEELLRLKEQGKIILLGGVTLPSHIIELGLVDEYYFVVHPIIAGEGARLLKGINLADQFQLKLVDTKLFKSGCVAHHYVK